MRESKDDEKRQQMDGHPGEAETSHIHRTDASILYVGVEMFHLCKARVQSMECAQVDAKGTTTKKEPLVLPNWR